ncbi:MAG: DUF5060 domain-containing protein [Spirochaetes bacterium]|nr:DUF5060 domain-containing protein [Spirochaetota bacterium]
MRTFRKTFIALLCIAVAFFMPHLHGADSFLKMEYADAVLEVNRTGGISLSRDGAVRISDTAIVIAADGWKGSGNQSTLKPDDGFPKRIDNGAHFRGTIIEPVSKTVWKFEQTVQRATNGFRLRYELTPATDTRCAEVSLFYTMPLAAWRGKRLVMLPQSETIFPMERPARRHFFNGVVKRAVLGSGSEQMSIAFAIPTDATMQDMREYKSDNYQLYPKLAGSGAVKAGEMLSIECTIVPADRGEYIMKEEWYSQKGRLSIDAALPVNAARQFSRYEIDLTVNGSWETPFDADQIRVDGHFTSPSGKTMSVPAFFQREHHLESLNGKQWIEADDRAGWKLRFSPVEPGTHTFHVTARDASGETQSKQYTFTAVPASDHGYIRVSKNDRRYFAFDDGTPYFAVGENLATSRSGVWDYDVWLKKLGDAGANYARIWMWSSHHGIEWGKPGQYRMRQAWELDHALEAAEKNGIYIKLCLESWRSFEGAGSFYNLSDIHPYWDKNGGPCKTEMEFFTNPEAKRMFKNRLRYVIARWGYSTHILGWEFWNEIDCVKGYHKNPSDVVAWTAEMARYCHAADPWRHLTVNSLGSFVTNNELWNLPEIDFAQIHGYWHPTLPASRDAGKDMGAMVPAWIGRISGFEKPALYAEFGLVNPTWGPSPRSAEDKDGVHLHNGLWSAMMAGACGTAMIWWWESYVDPFDLYYNFAAVSRFTKGIPWTTAGFKMTAPEASSPDIRAMALSGSSGGGKDIILVWLQNRAHFWWNVVEKKTINTIGRAAIQIPVQGSGSCRVEQWDTWKGVILRSDTLRPENGVLKVEINGLSRDMALKITGE